MSQGSICRDFSLRGVSLPLKDTLVYDCGMLRVPGNIARDGMVTVENDRGEGRTFIFRIPSHTRIRKFSFYYGGEKNFSLVVVGYCIDFLTILDLIFL